MRPEKAKVELRCRPNLPNTTSASSSGPARPRLIGWKGAGSCAIVSQARQESARAHAESPASSPECAPGSRSRPRPACAAPSRRSMGRPWARDARSCDGGNGPARDAARACDGRRPPRRTARRPEPQRRFLQVFEPQFELLDAGTALRRWPDPLATQPGDPQLQLFDAERQLGDRPAASAASRASHSARINA